MESKQTAISLDMKLTILNLCLSWGNFLCFTSAMSFVSMRQIESCQLFLFKFSEEFLPKIYYLLQYKVLLIKVDMEEIMVEPDLNSEGKIT